ncbi:MAG: Nre family DNA repair protein [Desulfurococcales archaeon]|nr:Nre family DNA repair protein [Desulfurococcales archaeon]
MTRINPSLCAKCKGYKRLCGLPYCPLLERYKWQVHGVQLIKDNDVEAPTPPSVLVGEHGYPYVRLYYTTTPGSTNPSIHDDPLTWANKEYSLRRIIALRSQTISGIIRIEAIHPWELYNKELSLAAVSIKPVSSEVILERKPKPSLVFNGTTKPMGPASPARKVTIEENPCIPKPIEKILTDDIKSSKAVWYLYRHGINIYNIIKAFTLGMTGTLRNRKIVPTRWGITAVDSIIADRMIREIRSYSIINEAQLYYRYYIGNSYTIIFLPELYEAEWIEIWYPSTPWVPSYDKPAIVKVQEDHRGKFDKIDGGYLAARLSVVEKLYSLHRQAAVLIIREVFPSYYAPVGNWQIRETVRKALVHPPVNKPRTIQELIEALNKYVRYDVKKLVKESYLIRKACLQSRLDKWLP